MNLWKVSLLAPPKVNLSWQKLFKNSPECRKLRSEAEWTTFLLSWDGVDAGLWNDSIAITLNLCDCTGLTSINTLLSVRFFLFNWQRIMSFSVQLLNKIINRHESDSYGSELHFNYFKNFILWKAFRLTAWCDDGVWWNSLLIWWWRKCLNLLNVSWCRWTWWAWWPWRTWSWLYWQRWETYPTWQGNSRCDFTCWRWHWRGNFTNFTTDVSGPITCLQLMAVHQTARAAFLQGTTENTDIIETAVIWMWEISELFGATEVWRRWRWSFWIKTERPTSWSRSWTLISLCLCICEIYEKVGKGKIQNWIEHSCITSFSPLQCVVISI